MTKLLSRGLLIFVVLLVASSLMIDVFQTPFGQTDFFDKHGYFFLIFVTIFPRLTLLFSSVPFGGVVWWLGFFFCPRILVAALATVTYFTTNPVLVVISWMVAIGGEVFEKKTINKSRFIVRFGHPRGRPQAEPQYEQTVVNKSDAIETEFTVKKS